MASTICCNSVLYLHSDLPHRCTQQGSFSGVWGFALDLQARGGFPGFWAGCCPLQRLGQVETVSSSVWDVMDAALVEVSGHTGQSGGTEQSLTIVLYLNSDLRASLHTAELGRSCLVVFPFSIGLQVKVQGGGGLLDWVLVAQRRVQDRV